MTFRPSPTKWKLLRNALPFWLREAVGRGLTGLGLSLSEFGAWLRETD